LHTHPVSAVVVSFPTRRSSDLKLMAEEYILSKPLPDNKRVYIIRPCMIHGPGNQGNLNLLYKVVEKGIPWPLAAFENKRSFLSIDRKSTRLNSSHVKISYAVCC